MCQADHASSSPSKVDSRRASEPGYQVLLSVDEPMMDVTTSVSTKRTLQIRKPAIT
jgi:hypothetical protein